MSDFPTNARELGKEIAAFATSGGGLILIGVNDEGDLQGVPNGERLDVRDQLLQRLEGVSHGTVKPPVTPEVRFGLEEGHVVMAIQVKQGDQPIYYANNVPYLRHLTQSRPADPAEVIRLVAAWLAAHPEADLRSLEAASIAGLMSDVILYDRDVTDRLINSLVSHFETHCRVKADLLRGIAASDMAVTEQWAQPLLELASALDAILRVQPRIGSGYTEEIKEATSAAAACATRVLSLMAAYQPSPRQRSEGVAQARHHLREVIDFATRFDELDQAGGLEELQMQVSQRGREIARQRAFALRDFEQFAGKDFDEVASQLHHIETLHLEYGDGGNAIQRLKERLNEAAGTARQLIGRLAVAENGA